MINKESIYEWINEVVLQTENQSEDTIINNNVDSNVSNEANAGEKVFVDDKLGIVENTIAIDLDQSSETHNNEDVHQEVEDEKRDNIDNSVEHNTPSSSISDRRMGSVEKNSEEYVIDLKANTDSDEVVSEVYNLRKSPRTRPINYHEQSGSTDRQDFYEDNNEPRNAPLKRLKYSTVSTSAPIPVNNNEHDKMASKVEFFVCDIPEE